jgi:hypothetical protein
MARAGHCGYPRSQPGPLLRAAPRMDICLAEAALGAYSLYYA